ncbi:hypothetical protein [Burkholderia cenocepacia]|uniref:hypothetical protein n=1 Tax=Burkholderia cenocepacia TaxID=95486 RepID=UPI003D15F3BF
MGLRQFVNGAPAVVYVQRIRLAGVLVMAHGMTAERVDVNAVEQPVKLLRCQFDHLLMPSRPHETDLSVISWARHMMRCKSHGYADEEEKTDCRASGSGPRAAA